MSRSRRRLALAGAATGALVLAGAVASSVTSAEPSPSGAAAVAGTTEPTATEPVQSAVPIESTIAPPATTGVTETSAPAPEPTPSPQSGLGVTIGRIVDGDTVDLADGQRVRILGYDTPEQGQCGSQDATDALAFILLGGEVTVTTDDGDDTDRYGRLLRHVLVDGVPVGLTMIATGNADARYDSLDGYSRHRYQDEYRAADGPNNFVCGSAAVTPVPPAPAPPPPAAAAAPAPAPLPVMPAVPSPPASNNGPFANCDAVRAAGRAPIRAGEPGFEKKFDRDGDGIGCE